jgi:hypothetical protein
LWANYLNEQSTLVNICVYASLAITLVSGAQYALRVIRVGPASLSS